MYHGHPYLTQKVCVQLVTTSGEGHAEAKVDALVEQLFFAVAARKTDHNLAFYNKVAAGAKVAHDPRSSVQAEIKLAGVLCAK